MKGQLVAVEPVPIRKVKQLKKEQNQILELHPPELLKTRIKAAKIY